MTNRFGLAALGATVLTIAGLAVPVFGTFMDDTPAKDGIEAKAAFTKLKTLAGSWISKTSHEDKEKAKKEHGEEMPDEVAVNFKLTGAKTALVETQFPGMPHEMVSVYHLDGKDLRMTHYCAAGNQPRLKLDLTKSTPDEFIFVFDGGSNLDPEKDKHIHGVRIKFEKDGKVKSEWEGYSDGKKDDSITFNLTRKDS
jgi:hypothetical protein